MLLSWKKKLFQVALLYQLVEEILYVFQNISRRFVVKADQELNELMKVYLVLVYGIQIHQTKMVTCQLIMKLNN